MNETDKEFVSIINEQLWDVDDIGEGILLEEAIKQHEKLSSLSPYKFIVINSIVEFFEERGEDD
tara:strand:- start:1668 stop:1859 length:192 start_codon:yes stop_codon:yes gene_type:complete